MAGWGIDDHVTLQWSALDETCRRVVVGAAIDVDENPPKRVHIASILVQGGVDAAVAVDTRRGTRLHQQQRLPVVPSGVHHPCGKKAIWPAEAFVIVPISSGGALGVHRMELRHQTHGYRTVIVPFRGW